jgi:hypothetical protein
MLAIRVKRFPEPIPTEVMKRQAKRLASGFFG